MRRSRKPLSRVTWTESSNLSLSVLYCPNIFMSGTRESGPPIESLMNKSKIICVCLTVLFFVLIALTSLYHSKENQGFRQKAVVAQGMRKALTLLMFDLREARENTIRYVPVDGLWHDRMAFDSARQGILEYITKEGRLYRTNKGKTMLTADHIGDLRFRRQKSAPDIVEVQMVSQKNVSLVYNLKVRISQ